MAGAYPQQLTLYPPYPNPAACRSILTPVFLPTLKFSLLITFKLKFLRPPVTFQLFPVRFPNHVVSSEGLLAFQHALLMQHILPIPLSIPSLFQSTLFHHFFRIRIGNMEMLHYLFD